MDVIPHLLELGAMVLLEHLDSRYQIRRRILQPPFFDVTKLLQSGDVAVVVPNPHSSTPLRPEPGWIVAEEPGPAGWSRAVERILDQGAADE